MTSCAEWTGVLLSTLLKECGLKGAATWFVAEGAEEVKGASSMPIAKAMDDCLVAYGMNGEAVRPQQGFPVRLMVPGFEGIFHTKWLRRIKVVDRYYMNYNDFGHLDRDPKVAALDYQIGPKSVITFPSGAQQLPGRGFYEISGLRLKAPRTAWRTRGSATCGIGTDKRPSCSRAARTNSVRSNRRAKRSPSTGTSPSMRRSACRVSTTASSRGGSRATGASPMALLKGLAFALLLGTPVLAQSPTYGVGRTPTAEEIRAWDISIGPTGDELPPGRGTVRDGAALYRSRGCGGCHGASGIEGKAPILKSKAGPDVELWARGRILPLRAPFATTVWDYINRAMPLNREGTLTADEVYALTAYLLYINDVIKEDDVLDAKSLPKVKMPIGENYARLPEWKPRTPRLKGYFH
jgi:mono/diheme cytochrome c family protein